MKHEYEPDLEVHRSRRWIAIVLIALSQLPLLTLLLRAVGPSWNFPQLLPGGFTGATIESFASPRLVRAGVESVSLAFATGVVASLVGLVIARGVLQSGKLARRVATVIMFFPVIAPPVALGVGVQVLFLRMGLGSTWAGVWLAHTIPAIGYVSLYFLGVLSLDDTVRDETARTLGASPLYTWWYVTLPALRQRLIEAFVLGALVSWGQLAITLLVGGGVVRTMPVEILAIVRSGDDHLAAIAALLLTVPPLLALATLRGGAERTRAAV